MMSLVRPPWRQPGARESLAPATVLLASTGKPFSDTAIARVVECAGGGRVRVVTIARIHGSSFGLQHPGLMPNKKERDQARAVITKAIKALQRAGLKADGEVVITRSVGRSFARAARAAGVRHVLIDAPHGGGLSHIETWVAARYVRYCLREVNLAVVSGGIVHDADRGHRQKARGQLDQLDRAV
jgi:hypothetical protein